MRKNEDVVNKVETLYKLLDDTRFRYTRQWYLNLAFYENNHFVWWKKSTQTVDRVTPPKGTVLRCVPKATRQIEALQNMILSSEPRWTVIPDEVNQDVDEVVKRVNHFLQEGWDHWNVRKALDELVLYALIYPYAVLETGYDSVKDDIYVDVYDAFDFMIPPEAGNDLEDAPYVIKCVRKTRQDIEANPEYSNTKDVIYDDRLAASEMKETRLLEKYSMNSNPYEELRTVIIKEAWFKIKTKEGNKMRVITVAGGAKLRDKTYELNQYPFVLYKPRSGAIYQPSWIEKFMPLNRSLDVFVSQIENFTNTMVRGRYLKQKNSSISRIVNEDGEVVEYDTIPPTPMEIPSIPSYLFAHMGNVEKWIDEGGVSTTALGKVPKGVRAYKAIESLKQSDFANLRVSVFNLQDCVQKLTEKILDTSANFFLLPRTIYRMEGDQPDYFNIIGERGADLAINQERMQSEEKPVVIKKSLRVKVAIENALSYTEEGKRDTLRELYQAGLIDKRTLLEGFKFGNIADIMEKVNQEGRISMTETSDFQILPPELQQHILQYLTAPENMLRNPIANAETIDRSRKGARTNTKRS